MNLVPEATPLRFFVMAVVAAFTISFSIASMASMTGMLPQVKVDPKAPSFMTPLTAHLQAAARVASQAPGVLAVQPPALTSEQLSSEIIAPAFTGPAGKASIQASTK